MKIARTYLNLTVADRELVDEVIDLVKRKVQIGIDINVLITRSKSIYTHTLLSNTIWVKDDNRSSIILYSDTTALKKSNQTFAQARCPEHSAIMHEFGHVVYDHIYNVIPLRLGYFDEFLKNADQISKYAKINVQEMIAEAFVSCYFGKKDIVSTEIWEFIRWVYNKKPTVDEIYKDIAKYTAVLENV